MKRFLKHAIIIISVILATVLVTCVIYAHSKKPPAKDVLSRVAKHGEDLSIYVDFSIDSSKPRFFVYDNKRDSLISSSKCAHGSGGGSTASVPVFSNEVGSNCSSLGVYKLTRNSRLNTIDMPCIRIEGLSATNSNAAKRGVVIHEAYFFADDITIGLPIPVTPYISQGCFGISTKTFNLLQKSMLDKKTIYLYAVYNTSIGIQ